MRHQLKIQPAMPHDTPILPGLSPIDGLDIHARFDGGALSSDGGVLLLREIERRMGNSNVLASKSPELNPVENVWQYLRQNWLSNTVFEDYDAILDAGCDAWRKLIAIPEAITSIGMRDWAHAGL